MPVQPLAVPDRLSRPRESLSGDSDLPLDCGSLPPLVEPAAAVDPRRGGSRYSRHLIIPDLGVDGQKRLKNARVLVIGAGGLGSPALLYLAAAGVGTIGIVEFDVVDESNLQRQIIHGAVRRRPVQGAERPRLDPGDQPAGRRPSARGAP